MVPTIIREKTLLNKRVHVVSIGKRTYTVEFEKETNLWWVYFGETRHRSMGVYQSEADSYAAIMAWERGIYAQRNRKGSRGNQREGAGQ